MAKNLMKGSLVHLYAAYLGAELGFMSSEKLNAFEFVEGGLEAHNEKMDLIAKLALMMEEASKHRKITWRHHTGRSWVGDYDILQTTEQIISDVFGLTIALKRNLSDEELHNIVLGSFVWADR